MISSSFSSHSLFTFYKKKYLILKWCGKFCPSYKIPCLLVAKDKLYKIIKRTLDHRKKNPAKKGELLMIDILIENCQDEDTLLSETFSFIIGGFHTTGNRKS